MTETKWFSGEIIDKEQTRVGLIFRRNLYLLKIWFSGLEPSVLVVPCSINDYYSCSVGDNLRVEFERVGNKRWRVNL